MAPLNPLFEPTTSPSRPPRNTNLQRRTLLFDNFQPSTWFLAAASLQGIITWLFPTAFTFIPALLILAYRALDVLLIIYGVRPNPVMDGVIPNKFSAQIPDENGDFDKPSRDSVVVLLLGAKSNHPLGILAPGFQALARTLPAMLEDLNNNREEYTYLTSSSWISTTDETHNAARGTMTVYYFRTMAGVHRFAHGAAHRAGWDWWNRTVKDNSYISIMHEVYEAPPGFWENISINYKPIGLATAYFPIKGKEGEREGDASTQWISSIVDGSKANLKTAKNRLGWDAN